MMDAEDLQALREVVLPWLGRWIVAALAVLGAAGVLGVALRIFDLVRG